MCLSFNIILWLPYKTFPLSWWIILSHWAYFNWTWGAFIHYSREGFFLSMFLGELFGISRKFLHRKFFSTIWMLKYYFLFKFICFQIWKVFFPVDNLKVELNYTCQYLLTHHFAIKCLNSLKLFQEFLTFFQFIDFMEGYWVKDCTDNIYRMPLETFCFWSTVG